ncbi:chorismate lyase [Candidatus Methylopumilus universalis]|uniref:chorismate--pyruvate lyase family protein n=1 Tax=Candidatus Methylopumilus universalis TaxID=2588536 RepID=UPI00111ED5D5|nr:chorismate lyase [Candidatus Methylopumilus universalis]QDC46789.1 chorismate lyase [Candidatus Methylopumilus universalis]QDC71309.1 chorismate lyase [Candidatus Methylopumilus universalis]
MTWLISPKVEGKELSWLTEEGSLTERLKKEFDDVKVEIMYEGVYELDKTFYTREVILKSKDFPRVFARTLVKEDDLLQAWSSLKHLGDQSLATILFNSVDIKKTSVFYKELFLDDSLFVYVSSISPIHKKSLWARKSSWEKQGANLDLIEIFL